jgi:predicted protein tyrosine phosphatase
VGGLMLIIDYFNNRLDNCKNYYQGNTKKVLCVCSAGLLRSPTAAEVLSRDPYNYNTRAAGLVKEYALILVDRVLLSWADEIVVMTKDQEYEIRGMLEEDKPIINLNIKDNYEFRNPELIKEIRESYDRYRASL